MARWESLGFCPKNQFINPGLRSYETDVVCEAAVMEEIKDHYYYLVYAPDAADSKNPCGSEIFLGNGLAGYKLAILLSRMVKVHRDTKILMYDIVNPAQIPAGCEKIESEKFVIGLIGKTENADAEIYCYRK